MFLSSPGSLVRLKLNLTIRFSKPQCTRFTSASYSPGFGYLVVWRLLQFYRRRLSGVLQYAIKVTSELPTAPGTALQVLQLVAFAFSTISAMSVMNVIRGTGIPSMGKKTELAARSLVAGNGGAAPARPPPPPPPPPPMTSSWREFVFGPS